MDTEDTIIIDHPYYHSYSTVILNAIMVLAAITNLATMFITNDINTPSLSPPTPKYRPIY